MMPEGPAARGSGSILQIPERVGQLYYRHGMFISRHPAINICVTIVVVLFVCYPLCYYPIDGSKSQQLSVPFQNFTGPLTDDVEALNQFLEVDTDVKWPLWYSGKPLAYIQQVIVKGVVSPWRNDLIITDAFKGPLSKVFRLFEAVGSFQDEHSGKTLSDICLHVNAPTIRDSSLPEYNCLILSPASFWKQDLQKFLSDDNFLSTVMSGQVGGEWHTTLSDLLLGVPRKESGLVWFPGKSKPRVLTYAITVVLRTFDKEFLESFHTGLSNRYGEALDERLGEVVHVYFPSSFLLKELTPLIVTYCAIFTYFYFSVRKCDMVKSKIGMAVCAVSTSLASLCCSVSLCSCFGFSYSFNGKLSHQIFPYLVSVICLENSMGLTRAVHSTQAHLDVKIRLAKAMSKEGWSITKNLFTETLVITVGILSFVPLIQEFCIFAAVALAFDFYLQMFFFATALSVDIRRVELSDIQKQQEQILRSSYIIANEKPTSISSNSASPRKYSQYPISLVAPSFGSPIVVQLPKRLRVLYFWSKWRMLQRTCFLFLFLSVPFFLYKQGIFHQVFGATFVSVNATSEAKVSDKVFAKIPKPPDKGGVYHPTANLTNDHQFNFSNGISFSSRDAVMWKKLPPGHWPALFSYYNMSLPGNYITVLPPLLVSVSSDPDETLALRHPKDVERAARWPSWMEGQEEKSEVQEDGPFVPHSPMEMFLMALLVAPSMGLVIYTAIVLYRCVCSRNYAEWRTSWNNEGDTTEIYTQVMMDSVPLVLSGHSHEVETLVVDGCYIVSCCLAGNLRIWDANTGECLQLIKRHSSLCYSPLGSMKISSPKGGGDVSEGSSDAENDHDGTECGSPPLLRMRGSQAETKKRLSEEFTFTMPHIPRVNSDAEIEKRGYDFSPFVTPRLEDLDRYEGRNVFDESFSGRSKTPVQRTVLCPIHPANGMKSVAQDNTLCRCPPHRTNHRRNWSVDSGQGLSPEEEANNRNPVWCLHFLEGLIVVGCGRGQIELWDSVTGELKEVFSDGSEVGVTGLQLVGNRLIAARLSGALDFLELRGFTPYLQQQGGAIRPSLTACRLHSTRAHQQPISVMDCQGGRVVTGSQDHTIKVHRLEDAYCLYTLHGHFGPITALFIDKFAPVMACTGSQDGSVALWDLESGTCVYRVSAHDGTVCSLTYTASYVISLGMDSKICVWERFQGHLLNTLEVHGSCTAMMMLTDNLLITTKQGTLLLWDLTSGATQPVRDIRLGNVDESTFIKQLLPMTSAGRLLVDYGRDLRVLSFPVFTSKTD